MEFDPKSCIDCNGILMPKDQDLMRRPVRGTLRRAVYERDMAASALALVQNGDRVLELGSGLGFVTAQLARTYDLEYLRCYEAHPRAFAYARTMLAGNGLGHVDLRHGVLGKRKGDTAFLCRHPFLRSSLLEISEEHAETVRVPVVNGNSVFRDARPNVLICDIEGSEADVLDAVNLSRLDRVLINLNHEQLGNGGLARVFKATLRHGLVYDPARSTGPRVAFFRP